MAIPSEIREILKMELGAEVLRAGGSIRLRVLGMSMLPALWPGDIVNVDGQVVETPVRGDIVLFERNDSFFVHRLLEWESKDRVHLVTRGDAMSCADAMIPRSQLLGRVSSIRRHGGTIIPNRKHAPFMRALGWTLGHCAMFRNLALRLYS